MCLNLILQLGQGMIVNYTIVCKESRVCGQQSMLSDYP